MQSQSRVVRTAAVVTLATGLGLGAAACGRYSFGNLRAMKAFQEATEDYKKQDYKSAAAKYEMVLSYGADTSTYPLSATYFYLGNSYDQMFKPSHKDDPEMQADLQKAVANYQLATEKETMPARRKLAYEYLISAYGPDKLNDFDKAEALLKQLINIEPNDPGNYQALAKNYQDAGRYAEAEAMYKKAIEVKPDDPNTYQALAVFYNSQGQFEKTMDTFSQAAAREPNNPEAFHRMAVYYNDKVVRDFRLDNAKKAEYIKKGIEADDKALALNPNYADALFYKNIFLRLQGNMTKDPAARDALYKQADELRARGLALQKQMNSDAGKGRGGN